MLVDIPPSGTLMRTRIHRFFYADDNFLDLLSMSSGTSFVVVDTLPDERTVALGIFKMLKILLDDGRTGYVPLHDMRHFETIEGPP